MIYYKHNKTGEVYAYDEEQLSHDIVIEAIKEMTLMTEEEVDAHINPVPTDDQLAEEVRMKRNTLLKELDAIVSNPLRWSSFTSEQQQELGVYRQSLLDVPQQEGFPHLIEWPSIPDFIKN